MVTGTLAEISADGDRAALKYRVPASALLARVAVELDGRECR